MKTMRTSSKPIIPILLMFTVISLSSCMRQFSESVMDNTTGMNGSFEQVKNGLPVNWLVYTSQTTETGDFDLVIDSIHAKDGKQSVCFLVRKCSAEGDRFSPGLSKEFSVHPGETYKIHFWTQNIGSEFMVKINGINEKHAEEGIEAKFSETTDDWYLAEYEYTIPEYTDKLRFEVTILRPGNFWIDDVKIEKVG